MRNEFIITAITNVDKYAEFHILGRGSVYAKFGYFDRIASLVFGASYSTAIFPVKVRVDELGFNYFHVKSIFRNGCWYTLKDDFKN